MEDEKSGLLIQKRESSFTDECPTSEHGLMEPYRIKTVERVKMPTREERKQALKDAGYNLFKLKADDVFIDLLTDSGTSAMSSQQWSALMLGDESYAGAKSFYKFEKMVQELTGHPFIIPTHQGRAAEKIIYSILGEKGKVFISNTFFDTTRGNIEFTGATALDLLQPEIEDNKTNLFKGNMDVEALKSYLGNNGSKNVPLIVLTITNNTAGGQPVSLENIRTVSEICKTHGIPLFFDACRFAENAYFIKTREDGYWDKDIRDIVNEMFSYVDGSTMSTKKDGLSNSGGWISLKEESLAVTCKNMLILTEGFVTYGGLAGRELEAIAQGLEEVMDETYLEHRIRTIQHLGRKLKIAGIPIVEPTGGHAIYIDAKRFASHLPPNCFPAHSIACQLYIEGGIRSCEIGSVMFGKEDENGNFIAHTNELVRLAFPRRVYTTSHMDYTVKVLQEVYKKRHELRGLEFVYNPVVLRHFTATFRVLPPNRKTSTEFVRRESEKNVEKEMSIIRKNSIDPTYLSIV